MGAPPAGDLDKARVFRLIAALKASEQAKSACGARLIAWYDDIAGGMGQ